MTITPDQLATLAAAFLEQQDDSNKDEWYGTDRMLKTSVIKEFITFVQATTLT